MKKLLICILAILFGFLSLNAQNNISGTVVSDKIQKSIKYASVYIDGTSKGTMTDSNGHFTIKNLNFPCRLVVSCVGYELKSIQLSNVTEEDLNIALKKKFEQLSGISVNGKSRRKQNLELFKTSFLGNDKWGQHAKLAQEDGLLFEHHYDTVKLKNALIDAEYYHTFKVSTKSPLTVKLPMLGYDAMVDIVSYSTRSCSNNSQTTKYDMFTHFLPYEFKSEVQKNKAETNRREVYYNSPTYFLRSLLSGNFKKNGIVTLVANGYTKDQQLKLEEFDWISHVRDRNANSFAITGMKGTIVKIDYYDNRKRYPIDLEGYTIVDGEPKFKRFKYHQTHTSYISFQSDYCVINTNGVVADDNIVFSGEMAYAVGGRLLPLNFQPLAVGDSVQPPATFTAQKPDSVTNVLSADVMNNPPRLKITQAPIGKFQGLSKQLQENADAFPQEKVYLHFDNTSYYLGENIWFKAYIVRSDRNSLTNLSKVLYVELLNAEGHLLDTHKLNIENGQCHGEFKLNPTQYGGYYEIRAYTRYMLNFGDGNFFSRVFPIYDKPKKEGEFKTVITMRNYSQRIEQKRPEYKQSGKLKLTFYPEGGNMIEGIPSKVAFRATTAEGEEVDVSGVLYKNKKDSVCSFSTLHQGMGSFDIYPDTVNYTAVAKFRGKSYTFPLPHSQKSGVSLSVNNTDEDQVDIFMQYSPDWVKSKIGISLCSRGVLYGSDTLTLTPDKIMSVNFPKRKLPSGVTQITLFDADGHVLSERLVFINHHSGMKMSASTAKSMYQPFEPVSMSFQLKDRNDKPVETTFSLSVRDAATCSMQYQSNNVLTDLLLSSELKGYIAHPGYYFESEDSHHQAALDLLLMVQGWSRYSWKLMAGVEKTEQKQLLEDGLSLEGSIVSLLLKKPMPNINLSMILMADSTSQHGTCKTDSAGNFSFPLRDFPGTARLILQTKDGDKKKETYIKLNRQFSPALKPYSLTEQNEKQVYKEIKDSVIVVNTQVTGFDEELKNFLPKNNNKLPLSQRNNLLKQVTVKVKRMPVKVGATYAVEKEIDRRTDEAEWLPADLNILLNFTCKYFQDGKYKAKEVKFIVENSKQLVSDANNILNDNDEQNPFSTDSKSANESIQPDNKETKWRMPNIDKIESVTFIEDYASIFRLCPNINIQPTRQCVGLIKLKKNYVKEPYSIRNTSFDGYSVARSFFSPQYDKVILPDDKDYRRTLYWNPDVQTDKNGKATVQFYNNDSCKSMLINAETVTANGVIGVLNK